jgi:hypothetical protein
MLGQICGRGLITQHDSHGPDDVANTIDYHHLDMSRDDGMDEHGNDWLYGYHLAARLSHCIGKLSKINISKVAKHCEM